MSADLLSVVEAAYAVERAEDGWLAALLDAASPLLNGGLGVGGYLYDASVNPIRTWGLAIRGGLDLATLQFGCATFSDDYRRANWLERRVGTLSEFPALEEHVQHVEVFARLGIRDVTAVNALDPSGAGCWLVAPRPAVHMLGPDERDRWARVATHIAAAVRLRARLARVDATGAADAVLTPAGRVESARGEAQDRAARDALRDAALAIERSRGPRRRDDEGGALRGWRVLVRGRWTLVDHFESDGRRYVLAHTNTAARATPAALSGREREVMERALIGHENKLIAYELGLADSTVRVLLRRAAAKLGVRSRAEAIERYRSLRGGGGEPR